MSNSISSPLSLMPSSCRLWYVTRSCTGDAATLGRDALGEAFLGSWLQVEELSVPSSRLPGLDLGESAAILLMLQAGADALLMDDRKGRTHASSRGFPVIGTIGILRMARSAGIIPAVAPQLESLRKRGFRISMDVLAMIEEEERRT